MRIREILIKIGTPLWITGTVLLCVTSIIPLVGFVEKVSLLGIAIFGIGLVLLGKS